MTEKQVGEDGDHIMKEKVWDGYASSEFVELIKKSFGDFCWDIDGNRLSGEEIYGEIYDLFDDEIFGPEEGEIEASEIFDRRTKVRLCLDNQGICTVEWLI